MKITAFLRKTLLASLTFFCFFENISAQNTDKLIKQGDSLYDAGYIEKASETYFKILAAEPQNAKVLNRIGNCFSANSDAYNAVNYYINSINNDSLYISPVYNLFKTYFELKEYEKANNVIVNALKIFPDTSNLYLYKGYYFNITQQYDSSKLYFATAHNKNISETEALYNIALIQQYSDNNSDSALFYIDRIKEINSSDSTAIFLEARIYLENEEFEKCDSICNNAYKIFTNSYKIHEILAESYLYQNKLDEAIIEAEKVLERDETSYSALFILNEAYMHSGNFETSYNTAIKASKYYPEDYIFDYYAAMSLFYMNKFSNSIEFFNIALEKKKDYPDLYYSKSLAALYLNTKENLINNKFETLNSDNVDKLEKQLTSKNGNYSAKLLLKKFKLNPLEMGFDEYFMLYYSQTLDKNFSGYSKSAYKYTYAAKYEQGDFDACVAEAKSAIENNFSYFNAYDYILAGYFQKGDFENYYKYYYIYTGFMKGISMTGNGTSADNAVIITSVNDEYAFLSFYGLTFESQQLINKNNHHYDVLIVEEKDQFPEGVFFLIDSFFGKF